MINRMSLNSQIPYARPGMSIGLFGGSFDPPHPGHVAVSRESLKRVNLDRVWWVPTPHNPFKNHKPAPINERIDACRAIATHPRIKVLDYEEEGAITLDTVKRFQKDCPGVNFVWIAGADLFIQLGEWEGWRELMDIVPMILFPRDGSEMPQLSRAGRVLRKFMVKNPRNIAMMKPPVWGVVDSPKSRWSSTAIRNQNS